MTCKIDKSAIQAAEKTTRKLDLPEGVPPLTSLYMYISGSCNLACRHCWIAPTYQTGDNGGQHIPVEYVRNAILEAKPLGLRTVKLTGGEPMLHPQFREIVSLINKESLKIVIETNGTLLDRDMARFLKQSEQFKFISVSVDGADPDTHEYMRCVKGSYESALTGIKNLVEQGFRPQLICTLHKGNVLQMEKVIELSENLGCGSVKFNHVQQIGRGENFSADQGLEVAEVIELYKWIEKEMPKKTRLPVHFDIPFAFHPIRKLLNDSLSGCTVLNILGILSGGQLSLCGIGVTTPELVYGHMENDSLREVWCNSPGLALLREQIPDKLEGICRRCIHRDHCLGSCVANNFHLNGRLNAPYQFCDRAEALKLFPESRKNLTIN
jgi:SynChlorMet cassette radical SAM/SPASM protein ScmF